MPFNAFCRRKDDDHKCISVLVLKFIGVFEDALRGPIRQHIERWNARDMQQCLIAINIKISTGQGRTIIDTFLIRRKIVNSSLAPLITGRTGPFNYAPPRNAARDTVVARSRTRAGLAGCLLSSVQHGLQPCRLLVRTCQEINTDGTDHGKPCCRIRVCGATVSAKARTLRIGVAISACASLKSPSPVIK